MIRHYFIDAGFYVRWICDVVKYKKCMNLGSALTSVYIARKWERGTAFCNTVFTRCAFFGVNKRILTKIERKIECTWKTLNFQSTCWANQNRQWDAVMSRDKTEIQGSDWLMRLAHEWLTRGRWRHTGLTNESAQISVIALCACRRLKRVIRIRAYKREVAVEYIGPWKMLPDRDMPVRISKVR